MRSTGTKQPAAPAPAAKVSATGLKPVEMKNDTGAIACLMSFLNAILEVTGIVRA